MDVNTTNGTCRSRLVEELKMHNAPKLFVAGPPIEPFESILRRFAKDSTMNIMHLDDMGHTSMGRRMRHLRQVTSRGSGGSGGSRMRHVRQASPVDVRHD